MLKPNVYRINYGFTTRSQVYRFVANQPRMLPTLPTPRKLSRSQHMLCVVLWLVLAPLLLLSFLVLGERPALKA